MYTLDSADSWTVISVDATGKDLYAATSAAVADNGRVVYIASDFQMVPSVYLRASPSGPTRALIANPYEGGSQFTILGISADGTRSLITVTNQTTTSFRVYNNNDGSVVAYLPTMSMTLSSGALSRDGRYVLYATIVRQNSTEPVNDFNQDIFLFDVSNPGSTQRVLISAFPNRFDVFADCDSASFLPNTIGNDLLFRYRCIRLSDAAKFTFFSRLSDPFNAQNRTHFYGTKPPLFPPARIFLIFATTHQSQVGMVMMANIFGRDPLAARARWFARTPPRVRPSNFTKISAITRSIT